MSALDEVAVRPLLAGDRPAVGFLLAHLGADSRYQRFHGFTANLQRETARLTEVDHWHHEVMLAVAAAPRMPIGVAEYIRSERFDRAELAIAIADGWQHRGVGRLLLGAVRARAKAAGVRHLMAWALPENHAALALVRAVDPSAAIGFDAEIGEIAIDLRA